MHMLAPQRCQNLYLSRKILQTHKDAASPLQVLRRGLGVQYQQGKIFLLTLQALCLS